MKRIFLLLIVLMLLIPSLNIHANNDVRIFIDGELLDANGTLINNTTLVPLRSIFEALKAEVKWESETMKVISTKGNTTIELTIGNNKAIKNGQYVTLSEPPRLINNSTYVPLRFIGEAFDCKVEWIGSTRTVNITTKPRANTAGTDIKDDVVVFDKLASKEVEDRVIDISKNEKNQTILNFEELPKEFENLKVGDKFILSQTESNPLGFIGKLGGKEETELGYRIIVDEVYFEEIFKKIDIDIQSKLTMDNLIEVQISDYAYFEKKDYIYNQNYMIAAVPGFDLSELFDNIDKEYSTGDFKIGLKNDVVIYDKDGKSETKNDQLRVKGSVALNNMLLKATFKYDEIYDWDKFYVDFECDEMSEISLIGELEEGIDLKDLIDSKGNDNKIDLGYIKIEGIDQSGTLTLASIVFDAATLTIRPDGGDPTKLPLAIIVSLTMDLEGKINTSFTLGYNYAEYLNKGINIQKKSLGKISEYDYETDNYYIDVIDEYIEKKNEVFFDVSGGAEVSLTAGPETMIMIGGIVPIDAKAHGGGKIDATTFDGNVKYDLTKPKGERLDYSIEFGDIYAKTGIFTSLEVKLQYDIWKLSGGFQANADKEFIFWEYDSSKIDIIVSDLVTFLFEDEDPELVCYYTGGTIKNVSNKTIRLNTVLMYLDEDEDGHITEIRTPYIIPKIIKPGESASYAEPGIQGNLTKKPIVDYEYVNDDWGGEVKIDNIRYEVIKDDLIIYSNITTKEDLTADLFTLVFYNKKGEIIALPFVDKQIKFKANVPQEVILIYKGKKYINEIDKIEINTIFRENFDMNYGTSSD